MMAYMKCSIDNQYFYLVIYPGSQLIDLLKGLLEL